MVFAWIDSLSAVPLASLPAVFLDTETTGLNVTSDRIVQIGAVKLEHAVLQEDTCFDSLVNPDMPIPAVSTSIHGIQDKDVAGAPSLETVLPDFLAWAGDGVFIGYSFGFDLGILKAEVERGGQTWTPPRSLDVRHLLQLVAPDHVADSLENSAEWLGVPVSGRHSALGDALTTARLWQALVPKLETKGITTLAAAERASLSLLNRMEAEHHAGWAETVRLPEDSPPGSATSLMDTDAYRSRVKDIMSAPPLVVSADLTCSELLSLLMDKQASSAFVAPNASGYGIVTERDILRLIAADPDAWHQKPAGDLAVYPLVTIPEDEFSYRAMTEMSARGFRHLGVVDAKGALSGALSARDLLRQRSTGAVSLGYAISTATTADALGASWRDLIPVVKGLMADGTPGREISHVISRELQALTERACEMAEAAMAEEGKGTPPAPYSFLVLGSGGRGESLLAMDQDNAIVYDAPGDDGSVDGWFKDYATRVSGILNGAGVKYCDGGIMAMNEAWRMNQDAWRTTIGRWLDSAKPEDVMHADIFFDSRSVAGDHALGDDLHRDASDAAGKAADFLSTLSRNSSNFDNPVGWFGRFKLTEGRLDLKWCGLMPIFSTARILALKNGILERDTKSRLEEVKTSLPDQSAKIEALLQAHTIFMSRILTQQLKDIEAGVPLSNKIVARDLTSHERQELRWALQQVNNVPDLLGVPAGVW